MNEKVESKNNFIFLILIFCLFIPSFLQSIINKQISIGTIVNAILFTSALRIKDNKKLLLISITPSIASISSGLLFNGLSYYSSLMLPIIWISNLLLIYSYKHLINNKKIYGLISIFIKVSFLYIGFLLISNCFNYPESIKNMMSISFGINQIYTSILGFIIFSLINWGKLNEK